MIELLDSDFLEKLIIKAMFIDKEYTLLISRAFEKKYFDNQSAGIIFDFIKNHVEEYGRIPDRNIIRNTISEEYRNDISNYFREVDNIDFSIEQQYDYLITQTNEYLKEQAVKNAVLETIEIIDNKDDREKIREKIENALTKDIKINLGLNYFSQLRERLNRIFNARDIRIPTYFPKFDEYISGGFPPLTLSVLVAKIHGFKSNLMTNFASRQVLNGHNIAFLSLEMSEDMNAQRFDSIYSLMDINRMYFDSNKRTLMQRLAKLKREYKDRIGNLYIKQFPTGAASIKDFRVYLRELLIRDIKLDIIYVDYINLMKSAYKQYGDLYSSVKTVAEELRALSFEYGIPVVSVSQLNREGSFVGFSELSFNYISESMGVPATADFMSILGIDEDQLIYENELLYKIVKNRLGGRVGEDDRLYYDRKTLKMYDATEIDLWVSDSNISEDERNPSVPTEERNNRRRNN